MEAIMKREDIKYQVKTELNSPYDRVKDYIEENGRNQGALIPILQQIQSEYHYLPEDLLIYTALQLGIAPATVYGVATFYAQFSLVPKGKYVIKICDGTACHVRGSEPVRQALLNRFQLFQGKQTTDDLRFTVETVSCLGACGLAPVVMINEKIYAQMTPDAIHLIIDQIIGDGD